MKIDLLKSMMVATTALALIATPAFAQGVRENYAPVTDDMLKSPPPGEWLFFRGNYNNQGYSQLDKINKDTVGKLQLAWAWPMAEAGIQETAPLVHDGVMFLQTNNNIVEALDAKTGDLIWTYRHALTELPASWSYQLNQARRQKNSIALYQDKVILTTADAKIVVLSAKDGKVGVGEAGPRYPEGLQLHRWPADRRWQDHLRHLGLLDRRHRWRLLHHGP